MSSTDLVDPEVLDPWIPILERDESQRLGVARPVYDKAGRKQLLAEIHARQNRKAPRRYTARDVWHVPSGRSTGRS